MMCKYLWMLLIVMAGCAGESDVKETPQNQEPTGPVDIQGERPPARSEMMGVFYPQGRQLVFFGGDEDVPENCTASAHVVGLDDTWVYYTTDARFEKVGTANPPPGRARGMAVYDSTGERMLIFGGRSRVTSSGPYTNHQDVWALNLETLEWEELVPAGPKPQGRSNPAGGYNALTNEMIVFGGNSSSSGLSFAPHNDVWAFSLESKTWRLIIPNGAVPTARLFHAAAVDSKNNRLFVYGGGDANAWQGPFLGDLWMMDLENGGWSQLDAGDSDAPMGRIWSTITYDETRDRVLLFGGHDDGAVGNTNDTWGFDVATTTWSTITEPEAILNNANGFCDFPPEFTEVNLDAPDRRSAHMAALDTTRMEWIVFGGKTDCGLIDDVWVFDLQRDAWLGLVNASQGEACVRGDQPNLCVALCQ